MLSLLSVALFFGNLLPIPVLDGGQIVISLAEIIKRSPIKPVAFSRYQAVGAVIVFVLIAFILFGDIIFVFNQ
jgi:regulator of sigma E protease